MAAAPKKGQTNCCEYEIPELIFDWAARTPLNPYTGDRTMHVLRDRTQYWNLATMMHVPNLQRAIAACSQYWLACTCVRT